jgi:hypothetical protein
MSLAFNNEEHQEYATRTEIHYLLRVPMAAIARAIDKGQLELYLIDGKVKINVAEARGVFTRKHSGLFD